MEDKEEEERNYENKDDDAVDGGYRGEVGGRGELIFR